MHKNKDIYFDFEESDCGYDYSSQTNYNNVKKMKDFKNKFKKNSLRNHRRKNR
jgi:hypothetical protein